MAALISERLPSISRLTMPISSVTLAWRMLVTTGNFRVSCQRSGSLMSLGGYISQRRICWLPSVAMVFLDGDFLGFKAMFKEFEIYFAQTENGSFAPCFIQK